MLRVLVDTQSNLLGNFLEISSLSANLFQILGSDMSGGYVTWSVGAITWSVGAITRSVGASLLSKFPAPDYFRGRDNRDVTYL